MKTKKKAQPVNLEPVLILAFFLSICVFAAYQLLKPPLFSRTLPVHPTVSQLKDGDWQPINDNKSGEKLDLYGYAVRGKYTIFDFQSEYCPACKQIGPKLVELTKMRADIAVRSIDINRPGVEGIDWHSPVCEQYHVRFAPYFRVYGPNCNLLSEGRDASDQVKQLVHSTLD